MSKELWFVSGAPGWNEPREVTQAEAGWVREACGQADLSDRGASAVCQVLSQLTKAISVVQEGSEELGAIPDRWVWLG